MQPSWCLPGCVRVNGQDVRKVSQKSLRAAIGMVPQEIWTACQFFGWAPVGWKEGIQFSCLHQEFLNRTSLILACYSYKIQTQLCKSTACIKDLRRFGSFWTIVADVQCPPRCQQDVVLFNSTIAHNLRYGNVDKARFSTASTASNPGRVLPWSWPSGYDVFLGARTWGRRLITNLVLWDLHCTVIDWMEMNGVLDLLDSSS